MILREFLEVYNTYSNFVIYDVDDNVLGDKKDGLFQYKRDKAELKEEWLDSEIITMFPDSHNHKFAMEICLAYKETILLNV